MVCKFFSCLSEHASPSASLHMTLLRALPRFHLTKCLSIITAGSSSPFCFPSLRGVRLNTGDLWSCSPLLRLYCRTAITVKIYSRNMDIAHLPPDTNCNKDIRHIECSLVIVSKPNTHTTLLEVQCQRENNWTRRFLILVVVCCGVCMAFSHERIWATYHTIP